MKIISFAFLLAEFVTGNILNLGHIMIEWPNQGYLRSYKPKELVKNVSKHIAYRDITKLPTAS